MPDIALPRTAADKAHHSKAVSVGKQIESCRPTSFFGEQQCWGVPTESLIQQGKLHSLKHSVFNLPLLPLAPWNKPDKDQAGAHESCLHLSSLYILTVF